MQLYWFQNLLRRLFNFTKLLAVFWTGFIVYFWRWLLTSRSFRTVTTRVNGKENVRKSNMFPEIIFCRLTVVANRDFTEWQTCLRCFDKGDKTGCPHPITVRCDARVFWRQTAASLLCFSPERVRSCDLCRCQESQ